MSAYKGHVYWQKWGGVATIAILLLALAGFNYWAVGRNQRDIDILSHTDLPLFEEIQSLRTALVQVESTVYEYYLTTDVERYNARFEAHSSYVRVALDRLTAELGQAQELIDLQQISREIQTTASEFLSLIHI